MQSDKQTILASFGQLNRHERFQIITKIVKDGSKTFVRKEAYSTESQDHIKSLFTNHKTIAKAIKTNTDVRLVNIIDAKPKQIDFEYISGQDLEQKVFKLILVHDYENAIKYINRVFDIIDVLSSKRSKQEDQIVKNINDIYGTSSDNSYISPGIIDLNLDNFFVDNNDKLVMFDYEWTLYQPVCVNYIKSRVLYYLLAQRYNALAQIPNDKHGFTLIDSGQDKILVPDKLFSLYKKYLSKDSIKKYLQAEAIFQDYVTNNQATNTKKIHFNYSISKVTSPNPVFPERFDALQNQFDALQNQFTGKVSELNSVIANQQEDISKLRAIISNIENSRSYKLLARYRGVKDKILPK
ncbi:hypothetical protein KC947_02065 [Candidatus Saccharibacteria bacterium]|nr:hypothetical protein [Candidatus Saccharibacteria bacterium]